MQSEHIVRTARDGVDKLDAVRRQQGISQMQISDMAGMPDTGSLYCRMYKRGDVALSKYLRFLRAAGYEIIIRQKEDADEKQGQ